MWWTRCRRKLCNFFQGCGSLGLLLRWMFSLGSGFRIGFDPCGISCVFCNEHVESVCFIFYRCHFLGRVWYHVFRWLGWKFVLHSNLASLLIILLDLGKGKKKRLGFLLIYKMLTYFWRRRRLWSSWFTSWKWFLGKHYGHTCSFYEWDYGPIMCWKQ